MNNSWRPKYTTSSPGFVYFKNNETSSPVKPVETSEFMGFSESQSPSKNQFSPRNYSSPRQQWNSPNQQYNPGNPQWGSPRNQHNQFRKNRFSNHNNSFSPNKTYNSSYNCSTGGLNKSKSGDKSFSKERFLHPSFMENPWAQLEKKLKEQRAEKEKCEENSNKSDEDCEDDNESASD